MRWRGLHEYGSRRSRGLSFWERWKNGQCVADIARALERRNKSGVYRILALNGGIAPAPRRTQRRRPLGALGREDPKAGWGAQNSVGERFAIGARKFICIF